MRRTSLYWSSLLVCACNSPTREPARRAHENPVVVAPGPLIEEAPRELAPPSASDEGPTVVPPPSPSDVVPPPSPRDEAPSSAVERPAPRTREVLAALRRLVDPPPHESGCEVVMDDPNASLASALAPFMRAADLRRVNCSPAG